VLESSAAAEATSATAHAASNSQAIRNFLMTMRAFGLEYIAKYNGSSPPLAMIAGVAVPLPVPLFKRRR
jgi:hypothetical protein